MSTIPERAVVLVDQDGDGIRITAVADDGRTVRTGAMLSPDVARQELAALLPWIVEPEGRSS